MSATLAEEWAIQGFAKATLKVLAIRFHSVPKDIRKAVESHSDLLALEMLAIRAAACKSIKEFREGLR
ncbi:MAG: hypothetical protein LBU64_12995 [Planctomycetota bacterium]|nr:hypothetical protein [Planctomycetota bacterium]